jgi:hypothetical protein
LERRFSLNVVCVEVIPEKPLNKFQAELLEKPEPPVRGIEFLGPSGELSNCSDSCSGRGIPFEAVFHSYHLPPGGALVVGVGFWIWLLEESIPVDNSQRLLWVALRWCHGRSRSAAMAVSVDSDRRVKSTSRLQNPSYIHLPLANPVTGLMMEPPACCARLGY